MRPILHLIIYMKKFLDSDWLRGVQFYFKLHCMHAVQINKTRAELLEKRVGNPTWRRALAV